MFKVMTWNVENLFRSGADDGPESRGVYEAKLQGLAATINIQAPDAVGLQEVGDSDALSDLVAQLDGSHNAPLYIRMEQEPGASGASLIDHYLRTVLPGYNFAGIRPTGSKSTRAAPVASLAEAGHLYLVRAEWNDAFLDELCAFPLAGHDDQVDALSGAFTCLVEESDYQEEWIIEYDARRDLMVNLTTGEVYDPPWPRRPMGFSPY